MKSLIITVLLTLGMALYKFLLGELVKTHPGLTAIIVIISLFLIALGYFNVPT